VPNPREAPFVPVIFDRYARDRMGAKAVAEWLNERGCRARAGGAWNHMAVLSSSATRPTLARSTSEACTTARLTLHLAIAGRRERPNQPR
jgi:glycine/serine hydroxymethyltransferase